MTHPMFGHPHQAWPPYKVRPPTVVLCVCASCLLDNMVSPIQEKLEDWKKGVIQLDRDHAKGELTFTLASSSQMMSRMARLISCLDPVIGRRLPCDVAIHLSVHYF